MKVKLYLTAVLYLFISNISEAQKGVLSRQKSHSNIPTCTAWNEDNTVLFTGGMDNVLKSWDIKSGRLLHSFYGHNNAVTSCANIPGTDKMVSTALDKTVRIWDTKSGKEITKLDGMRSGVSAVAVNESGTMIAAGSWSGTIIVWDALTNKQLYKFREQTTMIRSIFFAKNTDLLIAASETGEILTSNLPENRIIKKFNIGEELKTIAVHPSKNIIAALSEKGKLSLFDYKTGENLKNIEYNAPKLNCLAFSRTGKKLYSIYDKKAIVEWDIINNKKRITAKTSQGDIRALSKDNKGLLAVARGKEFMIVDAEKAIVNKIIKSYGSVVSSVDINKDASKIISGNRDNTLYMWDMKTGKPSALFAGHSDFIESVKFSPDNIYAASASRDKTIMLWNTKNKLAFPEKKLEGHTDFVTSLDFRIDGKYIVSGSSDKTVKMWKCETGECVRTFEGHTERVHDVSLSPDGKLIASASWDASIRLWNVDENREQSILKGHKGDVWTVDFSADGTKIVSGGADKKVIVWKVETGEIMKILEGHKEHVKCVTYNKDGTLIASGSWDNTIKIWNAKTGKCLHTYSGHKNYIRSVKFSEDNKYLISGSSDQQMKIWSLTENRELLSIITVGTEGDYVVSTPNGLFDGTETGIKNALHYVKDNQIVPLDAFFEKFYTPNLWARVISGEKIPTPDIDLDNNFKLPPSVNIISPQNNITVSTEEITLKVKIEDNGNGIDEIRLYHNGKLFENTERGFRPINKKGATIIQTFRVNLVKGENKFEVIAFNKQRTEGRSNILSVFFEKEKTNKPKLHLLTIGINKYKNETYNLNYAVADANSFAETVGLGGSTIFSAINKTDLRDAGVNKQNIKTAFGKIIKSAKEEDVFVFFYAGHGVMSSESKASNFYIVPHDITQLYGADENLKQKALSDAEIMQLCRRIKARKQLIIFDACQSGAAVENINKRGVAEQKALMQLARSAGVTVIAASGSTQSAVEFKDLGHGVFTYALIEALQGKADGGSMDGKITVNEVKAYLEDRVSDLTKKHRGKAQYPTSYSKGQDFPIVIKR